MVGGIFSRRHVFELNEQVHVARRFCFRQSHRANHPEAPHRMGDTFCAPTSRAWPLQNCGSFTCSSMRWSRRFRNLKASGHCGRFTSLQEIYEQGYFRLLAFATSRRAKFTSFLWKDFFPTVKIRIQKLLISAGHNFFGHYGKPPGLHPMTEVDSIHCIAGSGISGDRFFNFKPDYKGQITFFAEETYESICTHFQIFDKTVSVFRRNVITRNVDLSSLYDAEFEIQGVRFHGAGECAPCEWMNQAFASGSEQFLKGCGGLRARILSSGELRRD